MKEAETVGWISQNKEIFGVAVFVGLMIVRALWMRVANSLLEGPQPGIYDGETGERVA